MAKQYVIKTTGTVNATGLLQDVKPLTINNNKAPANVTKGKVYALTYFFSGNPGSTMSVTLEGAGDPLVLVKSSKMPEGRNKHGKTIFFTAP